MRKRVLFAIPARGGSKRLSRKNLRELNGRPMLAYTISAALESGISEAVHVCTEDDEIADTARKYGALVHRILPEMAGDEVSSPLRSSHDLVESIRVIERSEADFLVSVTPTDPHYFHWAMVEDHEGWRMYFRDEFLRERTQLPPAFRPNGAIKLAKVAALEASGNFFGQPLAVHQMPEERSIHVATPFDMCCAAAIMKENENGQA